MPRPSIIYSKPTAWLAKGIEGLDRLCETIQARREFPQPLMKFQIQKIGESPVSLMRRAGYIFQYEKDGEQSFVRVLARSGFPRFHCYIKISEGTLSGNIHLDSKKETYGHVTRHHGEYSDDGALKEETDRLGKVLVGFTLLA